MPLTNKIFVPVIQYEITNDSDVALNSSLKTIPRHGFNNI